MYSLNKTQVDPYRPSPRPLEGGPTGRRPDRFIHIVFYNIVLNTRAYRYSSSARVLSFDHVEEELVEKAQASNIAWRPPLCPPARPWSVRPAETGGPPARLADKRKRRRRTRRMRTK